jgi:hypothetical protein
MTSWKDGACHSSILPTILSVKGLFIPHIVLSKTLPWLLHLNRMFRGTWQLVDDINSIIAAPNEFDEEGSMAEAFHVESESQVDDNDMILEESNLLDVVTFPVAFTNSALHKIKLLKILLDIGAPNHYAFQSFMDWGRNCCRDDYNVCTSHPQPC